MAEKITDRVRLLRAANAGPMTLTGTNTWVLREPGAKHSVVIDSGPVVDGHIDAVLEAAGDVALLLYTHRHFDHTESFNLMRKYTGAPSRAVNPSYCADAEPLVDGEVIDVDGLRVVVHAAPGHTSDSACFRLPADQVLFSGDTVLGSGTAMIAYPDGELGSYFDSLAELRELIDENAVELILPGHGPVVTQPLVVVDEYIDHRYQRLDQVREALAAGAKSAREIVEQIYDDIDPVLWAAAELSVEAQLRYLEA